MGFQHVDDQVTSLCKVFTWTSPWWSAQNPLKISRNASIQIIIYIYIYLSPLKTYTNHITASTFQRFLVVSAVVFRWGAGEPRGAWPRALQPPWRPTGRRVLPVLADERSVGARLASISLWLMRLIYIYINKHITYIQILLWFMNQLLTSDNMG